MADGETKIIFADGAGAGAEVIDFTNTLAVPTDLVNDTIRSWRNLDVNGNEITSASNGNVTINPNGTGTIELSAATNIAGNVEVTGDLFQTATIAIWAVVLSVLPIHGNTSTLVGIWCLITHTVSLPNDVDGTRGPLAHPRGATTIFSLSTSAQATSIGLSLNLWRGIMKDIGSDYIGVYDNAISEQDCRNIITEFEAINEVSGV